MAFGLIRALHDLGRRVPEDSSVVGVDDIALAEYCSPSLTTVSQPFLERGSRTVSRVLRHIADPAAPHNPESVIPKLPFRASTAIPPPRAPNCA